LFPASKISLEADCPLRRAGIGPYKPAQMESGERFIFDQIPPPELRSSLTQ
jgi:hypothetical protein